MHTTSLRKVGGSVMLAIPPALLDMMHLQSGTKVGLSVDNGCIVVAPKKRPRYTLAELLAQCDPEAEISEEDRQWLDSPQVGSELI